MFKVIFKGFDVHLNLLIKLFILMYLFLILGNILNSIEKKMNYTFRYRKV